MIEFVRRMMIIILEDSILHPKLPFLAWLLLATSKNYIVKDDVLLNTCLQIVHEVANSNCRDPIDWDIPFDEKETNNSVLLSSDAMLSGQQNQLLIRSILCRQRFGGMSSDMRMLQRYSKLWIERLEGRYDPPPAVTTFTTEQQRSSDHSSSSHSSSTLTTTTWYNFIVDVHMYHVPSNASLSTSDMNQWWHVPLVISDIPPSAIDFHCCPDILRSLRSSLSSSSSSSVVDQDEDEDDLKTSMWYFSSSVNHKLHLMSGSTRVDGTGVERTKLLQTWRPLQKACVEYQKKFIRSKMAASSSGGGGVSNR